MKNLAPLWLVLAFALTTAALYACSLPLWEGFDEPFHYGYVQALSEWRCLPVQNRTPLSVEVEKSLALTPQSRIITVGAKDKRERRRRLEELGNSGSLTQKTPSTFINYESQQAPLAYLLLAPFDLLGSGMTLSHRVLLLRLIGSVAAAVLSFLALCRLMSVLALRPAFQMAVLTCIFGSQMFWASVVHVGNDWLAVPLTIGFLAYLACAVTSERTDNFALCSVVLALGLLTKAYFLAFVPIFLTLVGYRLWRYPRPFKNGLLVAAVPLLIAGPWYLHNALAYGSLSGTQESVSGVSFGRAIAAVHRIPWLASGVDFMRWSLWTGNWSFLSFSRLTLNIEIALLLLSGLLYAAHYRRVHRSEWWIFSACGCFLLGLVYQTCATFLHTRGVSTAPEPWYGQGIICVLWALCFASLQAAKLWGRLLATALLGITSWVATLTYGIKLLPFYGGLTARATARNVWQWWSSQPTRSLEFVTLGPVWAVYLLLVLFYLLLFTVFINSIGALWRNRSINVDNTGVR